MKRKSFQIILFSFFIILVYQNLIYDIGSNVTANDTTIIYDDFVAYDVQINAGYLSIATYQTIEIFDFDDNYTINHVNSIDLISTYSYITTHYLDSRGVLYCQLDHSFINIYDLSLNATSDQPVSQIPAIGGAIQNYFVHDNILYVAHGYSGLLIYNVTDYTNPVYMSTIVVGDSIEDVYVEGNKAFVICEYIPSDYHAYAIIDVTDPSSPEIDVLSDSIFSQELRRVYAKDGYGYVLAYDGLFKMTVSGLVISSVRIVFSDQSLDYDVLDDIMYISTTDSIYVVSFQNPINPKRIDSFTDGFGSSIGVIDKYAFLGLGYQGFMRIDIPTEFLTTNITSFEKFFLTICFTSISIVIIGIQDKKRR
ncbi:MAG: hypothetical protein ACTSO7_07955 [Candidatus Heimdallarchaeota archaeon]